MLKKESKILALFITFVLIFNIILPVISNAANDTTIGLVNAEGEGEPIFVKEGETFSVNVEFKNPIEDAHALTGIVEFDTSKLEIVNLAPYDDETYVITGIGNIGASINISEWHQGSNNIGFAHTSDFGSIKEGTSMTIEFRVKEGATGSFDISLQNVVYADARTATEVYYPITTTTQTLTGTIETPLESISLNKTETIIGVGSSEQLTVNYYPEETTDSKNVTWESSATSIATVENGVVKGIAPGEAVITANCNGKTASCTVTVTSKLQSISINKSTVELAKGQTEQLSIIYNPENTTDNKTVTWESSNPEIATIDPNTGLVTAIENGTTTITATSAVSGIEPATCKVTVSTKLQYIFFEQELTSMNRGEEETLTVGYFPEDTTDSKDVTWLSTNESVAKVENGKVTALGIGTTTIIADCNGKKVETTIEVKAPLESIDIGENFALDPLQEKDLVVTYNPSDTTDPRTIVWSSSDESVAKIENGKVTALKPGTTTITAKCGTITDSITVTVNEIPMEGIAVNTPSATIAKGETVQLSVIYYPENTTDNRQVTWTSEDDSIADVDENGLVTAVKVGTTTIKAQVGNWEATCEIEVNAPLKGITLNENKVTLYKGTTENTTNLSVIYDPIDTTDVKDVTWTSQNPSVATVEDGVVTAVGAGSAIIEAKVGEFVATCEVEVKVPLTGISIKDSTELIKNQSETLVVTYEPEDTTDDRTVVWQSSDNSVATVDENGKVTGLKEGTATITAKVGEYTAECEVNVKEIKLEGITIDNKIDTLLKGQNAQLGVIFTPENTTDDKMVTWSSSDESIVAIDESGKVTALKAGTVTITVTSGNFKDSFELTVEEIALTGIEIETENGLTNLKEGESLQLYIKYMPENTTDNRNVVYTSSDESVLTVDENGKVAALNAGTAIVTAVAENGVKTQIKLTVEQEEVVVEEPEKEQEVVESPQTGDINIAFYIGLMVISLVGIVKSIRKRK